MVTSGAGPAEGSGYRGGSGCVVVTGTCALRNNSSSCAQDVDAFLWGYTLILKITKNENESVHFIDRED